jgi:hypothetical protein
MGRKKGRKRRQSKNQKGRVRAGTLSLDRNVDYVLQVAVNDGGGVTWLDTDRQGSNVGIDELSGSGHLYHLPERSGSYASWNKTSGRIPTPSTHLTYRVGVRHTDADTGYAFSEGFSVGRNRDFTGLGSSKNSNPPRGYALGAFTRHVASDDDLRVVVASVSKHSWSGQDLWSFSNVLSSDVVAGSVPA